MRFVHPDICWLLLLLPLLLILMRTGRRRKAAFLLRLAAPALLHQTPWRFPTLHKEWLHASLMLVPFLSTILALADPRLPHGTPRLRAGTLDVVMLLDVSKSMAAEDDGQRSRLAQAREMAGHLLLHLRGNRVGLVTFAGASFRQAELTDDLTALDFIIQHWVRVDAIGVGGSRLARAIETGMALFPKQPGREQLMLLFSDGGEAEENLQAVLTRATHRGIRIITLGLGTPQPSRIPLYDTHDTFVGYMQINDWIVTTRLNEATLQRIATATGGTYLRLSSGEEWRTLLTRPAVVGHALMQDERKLFQPLLLLGLLAFASQVLLPRL